MSVYASSGAVDSGLLATMGDSGCGAGTDSWYRGSGGFDDSGDVDVCYGQPTLPMRDLTNPTLLLLRLHPVQSR